MCYNTLQLFYILPKNTIFLTFSTPLIARMRNYLVCYFFWLMITFYSAIYKYCVQILLECPLYTKSLRWLKITL